MEQALSHDFEFRGGARPVQEALAEALAPRYSVVPGSRPRTSRRTWLDTFDWRLHRAGLSLAYVTGHGPGQLVLTTAGGERISAPATALRWPGFAGALPDGPLRDRLATVAGERALLPAAKVVSRQQELRVCNSDDKTVAWLTVDEMSAARHPDGRLPARLSVTPVRGYQGHADRVARRLASLPGGGPAGEPALAAVLAASGRHPGDYSGKVDVHLEPEMPARLALAAVLLHLLGTLEVNVPGTLADIDTEFLHDLRVAVRRTRTALKLGGAALPAGLAERFRGEFKWLGDATTPTRDLDVYLLGYDGMAASLMSAPPSDLEPFHEYLKGRRVVERRRLARALRSARFGKVMSCWREALTSLAPPRRGPTADSFGAGTIRKAHRQVLARGGAITPASPPESLHDLRKRCKELRYALEFFASLAEPAVHRQAVRDLKALQDCLGTFQDCQVQQHEIRAIAASMVKTGQPPVSALLAMGDLAAQVAGRERQARSEFAGRFAEFASPANQRRFRALTTAVPQ